MRLHPLVMPVLVLCASAAALGWLLFVPPPAVPDHEERGRAADLQPLSSPAHSSPAGQEADTGSLAAQSAAPIPGMLRNVSPDGVTPPPVSGPLTRVAPSEAYLENRNPPRPPVPPGPLEFSRVQVLDAGTIDTGDILVRIAHVTPLGADQSCRTDSGDTWPCGARARTAMRGLLRQLKIECEKIDETGPGEITATCQRGRIDLGEWLVRYGWATPAETAPPGFADVEREARERKLGQWKADGLDPLADPVTIDSLADIPDLPDIIAGDGRSFLEDVPARPSDGPSTGEQPQMPSPPADLRTTRSDNL
ncbi:membrane protein [Roseibium aquae]|uniref:Membrane protein n=1 Tax=Roseibium aquae TaxID=1323746 RepID=A0A916X2B5_9HYPH|nr:thermonuclease family protein [Roseibium aquae]GGB51142.1 membrane protein [Roseibium aquae]